MTTLHGRTFTELSLFWKNLSFFFHNHKTLFEIIFLLVYTLEQIILVILILLDKTKADIYAGIFAILVITTVSFEKVCMESRYTFFKDALIEQEVFINEIKHQHTEIIKNNKRLWKVIAHQK